MLVCRNLFSNPGRLSAFSTPSFSSVLVSIFLGNINDLLEAYIEGWTTIGSSHPVALGFNLFFDLFSVLVLIGIIYFLIRRFIGKPRVFEFNKNVKLQNKVAEGGIRRDSLIVGIFIILHVGSRWLGTAFHLGET
ncbi:MAG: hypothetical protein Ct9H300mP28_02740 [Pseudomonadota bacterium]|nr:MAG: hypothetical protein Ct9H300mP28_02740 [Pseudomonadota bacterium]